MDRFIKPRLEHIKGDTWCIVTGSARIPLYMPDKSHAVMIDSGLEKPDRYGIWGILEQEQIRIDALLTSHFHHDHTGNHHFIKSRHGSSVYMSPFTASMCGNASPRSNESDLITVLRGGLPQCHTDVIFDPHAHDLQVGDYSFKLIPLPGHAQEHTGFVTPDGVAYLGDTILSRDILYAVRLPFCSFCKEDLASKAVARELPYDCYIAAHNCVCSSIRELAQENIDNLNAKLDMIQNLAGSYVTLEGLTARVMEYTGADMDSLMKVLRIKRNMQVFVDYLYGEGRLDIRAKGGYIEYIKTT